jgi:hypothetical protein
VAIAENTKETRFFQKNRVSFGVFIIKMVRYIVYGCIEITAVGARQPRNFALATKLTDVPY